jgi:hypothetical protein
MVVMHTFSYYSSGFPQFNMAEPAIRAIAQATNSQPSMRQSTRAFSVYTRRF